MGICWILMLLVLFVKNIDYCLLLIIQHQHLIYSNQFFMELILLFIQQQNTLLVMAMSWVGLLLIVESLIGTMNVILYLQLLIKHIMMANPPVIRISPFPSLYLMP